MSCISGLLRSLKAYFKIEKKDKWHLLNWGACSINSAILSLCLLPVFANATNKWWKEVNNFLHNKWLIMYCLAVFILFIVSFELLAMGFKKEKHSIFIIVFMIINVILFSGITGTWDRGWLLVFFVVYSIFMGIIMWKVEKYLFTLITQFCHKIPKFSDTAQVALVVGLVTPVITILTSIISKAL